MREPHPALLLRGSSDFESEKAYSDFVTATLQKKNQQRAARIQKELEAMKVLRVERLMEFSEIEVQVTQGSTIRVQRNTYSVPSRLIGARLRVRVHEDRIQAFFGEVLQLETPRLLGEGGCSINYRHVINSLCCKPGAFERWRYREELFPTLTFRRAYDALEDKFETRRADAEYLRILRLAAGTVESDVDYALTQILEARDVPIADAVRARVIAQQPVVPSLPEPVVDLGAYNDLLGADLHELSADGEELQA